MSETPTQDIETPPRRFRPYSEYQDSGIEWLGEIPAHWNVKQVRQAASQVTDGAHISPDRSSPDFPFISTVDITGGSINFGGCLRTSATSYTYMKRTGCSPCRGDVLFSKDGTVGTTAVVTSDREFAVASSLVIISPHPRQMDPRWLAYWLNSAFVRDGLDLLLSGAALRRISVAKVGRLPLLLPQETDEQRAIATFLDRETARIDALVAKKERLIELLQEKRTALITRAVTKGLNRNVPMKDSGVEWLGEIPTHWKVVRLGYLAAIGNGSTPGRDSPEYWVAGTYPWLTSARINDGVIAEANEFVTRAALQKCHLPIVPAGSVLVAITGEGQTRGRAALLVIECTISQHLAYLSPRDERCRAAYIRRFFESCYEWLRSESSGAGSTRAALTCEFLRSVQLAIPPAGEQDGIVAFLDRETAKLDALIAKVREAIDLLKEHRTALISAAVTGKIDVRAEVA